jgi:hypothetical protein
MRQYDATSFVVAICIGLVCVLFLSIRIAEKDMSVKSGEEFVLSGAIYKCMVTKELSNGR